jgi:hypothetical protein
LPWGADWLPISTGKNPYGSIGIRMYFMNNKAVRIYEIYIAEGEWGVCSGLMEKGDENPL